MSVGTNLRGAIPLGPNMILYIFCNHFVIKSNLGACTDVTLYRKPCSSRSMLSVDTSGLSRCLTLMDLQLELIRLAQCVYIATV